MPSGKILMRIERMSQHLAREKEALQAIRQQFQLCTLQTRQACDELFPDQKFAGSVSAATTTGTPV